MAENKTGKQLSAEKTKELLQVLRERFEKNMSRHEAIKWEDVEAKLTHASLWSLNQMEETGGEPDVISYDEKAKKYLFCDCSEQSPKGRRSICYDREALEARKQHKPRTSAVDMAEEMGIEITTEEQYRELQKLGNFDTTTSSWLATPKNIRELGGAIFADRRYDSVFVYHNGADSYYAARGFRGVLRV